MRDVWREGGPVPSRRPRRRSDGVVTALLRPRALRRDAVRPAGMRPLDAVLLQPTPFSPLTMTTKLSIAATDYGQAVIVTPSDTVEHIVKAGLDLVVRYGPVPGNETSLVARVIAEQDLLLVASPAYLDQAGEPATLNVLLRHRTVFTAATALPGTGRLSPTERRSGWTHRRLLWLIISRRCSMPRAMGSVSPGCPTSWSLRCSVGVSCSGCCRSNRRSSSTPTLSVRRPGSLLARDDGRRTFRGCTFRSQERRRRTQNNQNGERQLHLTPIVSA